MSEPAAASPRTVPPGGRAHWIDALRGLSVLLVTASHVYTIPRALDAPYQSEALALLIQLFHAFRMPLLLFLSGMLLPRSVRKPLPAYARGKLERIAWPALVWTALLAVALGTPGHLRWWDFWVGGPWHLWFLWTLMFCYAVGVLTRWVPPLAAAGVLLAVLLLGPAMPKDLTEAVFWGIFFFLGAASVDLLPRLRSLHWSVAVVALALTVAVFLAHRAQLVGVQPKWPWSFVLAVPGIVLALWVGPRLPRLRFLEFCGRRSIVLYAAHLPLIGLVANEFGAVAASRPVDFFLMVAGAAFLGPLALAAAYRWTRWLFESPTASLPARGAAAGTMAVSPPRPRSE